MPVTDTASPETQERFKGTPLWKPWMEEIRLVQAASLGDVQEFLERGEDKTHISWDLETESLDPHPENVVGHCIAFDGMEGMYIPTRHSVNSEANLDHDAVWEMILEAIAPPRILVVFNWKFEGWCLRRSGVMRPSSLEILKDAYIYSYLKDPNNKKLGLKAMSQSLLGFEMLEIREVPGAPQDSKKSGGINFGKTDPEEATLYAAADPVMTLRIIEKIGEEVENDQKFICSLEHSVLEAAFIMEDNPVTIDRAFLKRGKEDLIRWKDVLSQEIYAEAGHNFNIGSAKEVGDFLEKKGVPLEKTKSGKQLATGDKEIRKHAAKFPIVGKILLWRSIDKERGTYVECLLRDTSDENPTAVFKFKSVGAPTGRWAGGGRDAGESRYAGVNVQSIPNANAYMTVPCYVCTDNFPTELLNTKLVSVDEDILLFEDISSEDSEEDLF